MTDDPKAITRIRIEGFRSLRDVTLEPGRITVLIGPNGAGKSNLLAFLQMIALIRADALQRFVAQRGGASALLHYGPKVTPKMAFRLDFEQGGACFRYEVVLGHAAGDTLYFEREAASRTAPGVLVTRELASARESTLSGLAHLSAQVPLREVSQLLASVRFYHFHDTSGGSSLRQHAVAAQDRVLADDGKNLAAFLYRLKNSTDPGDQAAWRRITLLVRRMAPAVAELAPTGVVPGEDPPSRVRLDWVDDQGETFGVQDLSDGTLRAIALVTALAQPASTLPAFITIDEPELGLHPAALSLFAGLVRSVSTRCQVVLATQSPALLDHFAAEDVVVVERQNAATTLRRLDAGALAGWLQDYSLSELFDKNVLGGRP